MTQIAFPADLLRQLQENVSFDLGAIEDIRAAMQEISDRLNHRTGILGQAVQSLDSGHRQVFEGCVTVENQLEEFKRILRAQQTVIEEQASTWTREMAAMRDRLEDNQAVINQQLVVIDQAKQREALLLAKVESMAGRLNEMETMLSSMSASVNEHKGRLSIHETYISAAVSSQATGSQEGDAGAAEGDLAVQVRMLAERVDQELAQIARGDAHDAEAGSLKDLNAAVDQLDERVTALETSMEEWENADCEDDQRPCESEAHVGGMPQRFDLTPNLQDTPTWGNQEPADEQEPDATAMWWQQPFEFSSTEHSANVSIGRPTQNVWGISDPPGLPAYLRAPNVVADNAADPGQGNVAPVPAAPPPKAKAVRKSPPVVPKGGYGPYLQTDDDFPGEIRTINLIVMNGLPYVCSVTVPMCPEASSILDIEEVMAHVADDLECCEASLVAVEPATDHDESKESQFDADFVEVRRYLTQQYKQCNRKVCSVTVPMCPEASSILDIEEVMAHVADDLECCEASLVAVEPATDHDESKESQFDAVMHGLLVCLAEVECVEPRLTAYDGGEVWVADPKLERSKAVWRKTHDDKPPAKGRLLSTSRTIAEFDPFQMHGTEPFRGHRIVVTAFTPAAGQQTSERMRAHLEREYGPEEAKEADFFQAAKCEAACNKAVESSAKDAEVTKSRDKNLEWLEGKTCTVCGKSSKACYLEKLDKVTPEPCGYQVPGFDEEAEMVEQERLAQELKSFKASAEPCGNDVFFGPRREDWIGAARKELDNMTVHQKVWIEVRKGHIHEDLGLDRSVKLPKALPMQLVNTLKPLNESSGPIDEPKVRIVACGNFQHDSQDKEDLSTQNVDMSVLRTMAKETALRPSWIMGAGDISAAFLNTFLGGKDLVILEPPAVLKRLGLIAEDVQYVPIRAIYGLRRSPLDWSRDRDGKISGKVLTDDQGRQIHCVPIAHQDGLWKLLCGDTLVGLVAMYVDDCLVTGERSAVEAFLQFVSAEWRTKIQGFIARQTDVQVKCNDEQVAQKQALNFLGVEISFEGDKIVIQQRRWILQELNRRGWVHMKGSQSLPQLEMAEDEALDEHHAKNLANARSEIGALMWIGIRSRPDVLAAVSMGASVMHRRPEAICKFCVGLWRYVRGTLDECLQYGPDGNPGEMTFISDASFAPEGSRSRTGGVLCYAGSVIHWFSCRQTVTAWSVCEAETDALAETLSQGIRLTYVLQDLLHKPVTRMW
ncbi:TY2B-LR1 [Symbiodinium sp. CCMP2592]|nr:TY2B-LR1 [Symbiodinium sp. CCMP2592]